MIYLDDDLCLREFNQISNFLDHLYKTRNFKFYWPILFLSGGEEPIKEENRLNGATAWPTSVRSDLVSNDMKHYHSKTEFLKGVHVYLQRFVKVVIDKSGKIAQCILNALKRGKFLRHQQSKLYFRCISLTLLEVYWSVMEKRGFQSL